VLAGETTSFTYLNSPGGPMLASNEMSVSTRQFVILGAGGFYNIFSVNNLYYFIIKSLINGEQRKHYTGRFIMYSGITKIYGRKTVGHVFTKPVQIEGTQKFFSPESCFSS
jgi:hypothetical protein